VILPRPRLGCVASAAGYIERGFIRGEDKHSAGSGARTGVDVQLSGILLRWYPLFSDLGP